MKDFENSHEQGGNDGWLSLEEFSYMYMFLDFKGEEGKDKKSEPKAL